MDSVFCVSWVNSETLNCPYVLIYHEDFATLHFIVHHPAIISLSWDWNLFKSAMSYLQALSLIFLGNSLAIAYMPTRPCSWKTCNGYEWRNDWSPSNIPPGDCITQKRSAHYSYTTHHGSFYCPPTIPCFHLSQKRTKCKWAFYPLRNDISKLRKVYDIYILIVLSQREPNNYEVFEKKQKCRFW